MGGGARMTGVHAVMEREFALLHKHVHHQQWGSFGNQNGTRGRASLSDVRLRFRESPAQSPRSPQSYAQNIWCCGPNPDSLRDSRTALGDLNRIHVLACLSASLKLPSATH